MSHDPPLPRRDTNPASLVLKYVRLFPFFFHETKCSQTALYGKAYIPAAKDTWRLMKDRGIDALVNDSLVGTGTF